MNEYLKAFLDFFSLETLDTRLLSTPAKRQKVIDRSIPQSKWHTLEFKIYAAVFATVVPLMYKTCMDASNETNPNYPKFERLLSQGWMFGRKVDNSDAQYRFFRDNFPLIGVLIAVHFALRRVITPSLKITKRTYFDCGCGLFFVLVVHGVNVWKIGFHVTVMYLFSRYVPSRKWALLLTWVYGLLTLFVNDRYRNAQTGISLLDSGYKGLMPRWDVNFNFTLLRLISFNYDYLEKVQEQETQDEEDKRSSSSLDLSALDDRERLTAPIPLSDYNLVNFIGYLTYTPLFIAGPIITFNDYVYQSNYQQLPSVKDRKRTFIYFVRLMFCILVMEFIMHFMYVLAVSKTKAWEGDTPFQISMVGLFNLNLIWLKLLIPWRLFRFWSLLDGIDPPENMIRCMDNNYSTLAFWRAWHRSFNRWVTRYIYVPLGGSTNRIVNSLCVFSFVAIWHDIELKLLMWGWLIVLFLLPEMMATVYFKRFRSQWWYRHLCGVGAVINIWMMMIANLFGFCLGQDGTLALLREMFSTAAGLEFFVLSLGALFSAAQVMFELREAEKRKGIDVRC